MKICFQLQALLTSSHPRATPAKHGGDDRRLQRQAQAKAPASRPPPLTRCRTLRGGGGSSGGGGGKRRWRQAAAAAVGGGGRRRQLQSVGGWHWWQRHSPAPSLLLPRSLSRCRRHRGTDLVGPRPGRRRATRQADSNFEFKRLNCPRRIPPSQYFRCLHRRPQYLSPAKQQ